MDKITFIQMVDFIFKNKDMYDKLEDSHKNDTCFMVQRKFAVKYLKSCNAFNYKCCDKASVMDVWNLFFRKENSIPGWYWQSSPFEKNKIKNNKNFTEDEIKYLKKTFKINDQEFTFLEKYRLPVLQKEIEKYQRFQRKEKIK